MRKELEQIIFLGKLTDTIEIFGKMWTIETLNFADQVDLQKYVGKNENDFDVAGYKKAIVKKVLKSVGDIEIQEDEKEEFVSRLPMAVIDKIVIAYQKLNEKLGNSISDEDSEEIKN